MTELAIRIRIADRDYPMRVSADQEARLRAAGRHLNERIKLFREQFGLQDQDLLAMIALESVADRILAEQQHGMTDAGLRQRLDHLHELLLSAPTGPLGAPTGAPDTTGGAVSSSSSSTAPFAGS